MASRLHEGSRWVGDMVIDSVGMQIECFIPIDGPLYVSVGTHLDFFGAYPEDLLAVIRRANLDPLAIAARELVATIRPWIDDDMEDVEIAVKKLEELLP